MEPERKIVRCKKCDCYYDAAVRDTCPYCETGMLPRYAGVLRDPACKPNEEVKKSLEPPMWWNYPTYPDKEWCPECREYYDTRKYSACPHCSPVGWLEAVEGPYKGERFKVHAKYNYIGSEHGDIRLPNDPEICREKHAAVAYDSKDSSFYFGPASWRIVKLNGHNVYNYEQIHTGDVMEVGGTKLVLELIVEEDVKN